MCLLVRTKLIGAFLMASDFKNMKAYIQQQYSRPRLRKESSVANRELLGCMNEARSNSYRRFGPWEGRDENQKNKFKRI